MIVRKIDAARGLAKIVRSLCSNARPRMPAGTVATMSNQAMRSSGVSILRVFKVRRKPPMMRTQS